MRSRSLILLAAGCTLMSGCAPLVSHPPLPTVEMLPKDPYGSFIVVKTDTSTTAGELLAVHNNTTVYLLADNQRIVSILDRDVKSAHLVRFNPRASEVAGLTFLGVLSTLSNGWGLIFTAPAWILAGTAAATSRSSEPHMTLHKHDWKPILPYARFPAGLPPGFLTTPPASPPPPVVAETENPPEPSSPPRPAVAGKSEPRIKHFAMNFGAGPGFHENAFRDLHETGFGVVGGISFETKAAFTGTRFCLAHREVTGDDFDPEWQTSGESVDLALLFGLQGQFKSAHVELGLGPATYGAKIEDVFDFNFSLAYQAGLTAMMSRNLGVGAMFAYNQNEFRDFYVVAVGVRFVVW